MTLEHEQQIRVQAASQAMADTISFLLAKCQELAARAALAEAKLAAMPKKK